MGQEKKQLLKIINTLWSIIDDIDTYSDMAKEDNKLFRKLVESRQKDRWKLPITTDGYKLKITIDDLDSMGNTELCTYPECRCPFDMGPDNKCLIGLENKKLLEKK